MDALIYTKFMHKWVTSSFCQRKIQKYYSRLIQKYTFVKFAYKILNLIRLYTPLLYRTQIS